MTIMHTNVRHELKEQLQEWTVYGIIEGEQDFQKAFNEAIDFLELNESEMYVTQNYIYNEAFVRGCYKLAELEGGN